MSESHSDDISRFVAERARQLGRDPLNLLQVLWRIQARFGHVSGEAAECATRELGVPRAQVDGVIEFYSFLHTSPRGDYDILVSDSISDHMLGKQELMDYLCKQLGVTPGKTRADGRVTVDNTSCTGMCDQGPAALVNGRAVTKLSTQRIDEIVALVEGRTPLSDWPAAFFAVEDNIRRADILLADDFEQGSALQAVLGRGAKSILDEIGHSGLRGRGGAGFKTGMKWSFCRHTPAAERYVVCNADEGEPGTFKDRILLQSHADLMFEGMTLCGRVIGARKGYLYLRGEYLYLLEDLEAVLNRRREAGLLGEQILGADDFSFDIEIHLGAGAYICGEESALIESLEGKRGIPRIRPPFPVTQGYRSRPTVVNNVETFSAAAKIAARGAGWFIAAGTPESTGTKLLSICGDCERPGIYEYPYGVTVQQVLEDCGAMAAQAVQVAGPAGHTIAAREFGRTIAFEDLATGGSFMVFGPHRDMLEVARNFTRFFAHESCGFCTPCRIGTSLMRDLMEKVYNGHGSPVDLEEMRNLGTLMTHTAHCGLGTTAANPVTDTLEKFPEAYERRLQSNTFEPAFDLDGALEAARQITGRDDAGAHL